MFVRFEHKVRYFEFSDRHNKYTNVRKYMDFLPLWQGPLQTSSRTHKHWLAILFLQFVI